MSKVFSKVFSAKTSKQSCLLGSRDKRRLFTISVKPLSFKNNEVLHSGQFSGEFYCLKRIVGNYFKTKYRTKGFEAPTDVFALFPNFLCAGRSSRASGENRSFGGERGGGIVVRRE